MSGEELPDWVQEELAKISCHVQLWVPPDIDPAKLNEAHEAAGP